MRLDDFDNHRPTGAGHASEAMRSGLVAEAFQVFLFRRSDRVEAFAARQNLDRIGTANAFTTDPIDLDAGMLGRFEDGLCFLARDRAPEPRKGDARRCLIRWYDWRRRRPC